MKASAVRTLRAKGEDIEGHRDIPTYDTNIHGNIYGAVQGREKIKSRQKGSRSRWGSSPGLP